MDTHIFFCLEETLFLDDCLVQQYGFFAHIHCYKLYFGDPYLYDNIHLRALTKASIQGVTSSV